MQGLQVTYGTEIQLMHFKSQGFLNGMVECSQFDKSAYLLQLSQNFNYGMIFKILPRFSIKQEGEKIQMTDQIFLYNVKLDCFVNYYKDEIIYVDRPISMDD